MGALSGYNNYANMYLMNNALDVSNYLEKMNWTKLIIVMYEIYSINI